MKIQRMLLPAVCLWLSAYVALAAGVDAGVDTPVRIDMAAEQQTAVLNIELTGSSAFAGAEFGLQCPEDVSVQSVSYSQSASVAGPTTARGLIWFSFFSGGNDFSGSITATVTLNYTGRLNTAVVLDQVKIYSRDGEGLSTQTLSLRKTVILRREGADNEATAPTAPTTSTMSGVSSRDETQTTGASALEGSYGTGTTDNGQSDADVLAGGITDADTTLQDTPDSISGGINILLLCLLLVSLCGNFVMGYFIVQAKKQVK